jgi:hypothetical protein
MPEWFRRLQQLIGRKRQLIAEIDNSWPVRAPGEPVTRRADGATSCTPVARPDAARRGSGAHARVPSLAPRDELTCGRRSCPSAAVRDGYGQRRPPSRASSSQDGSSRAIAASFSQGWTGLGRRAPWGRLTRRPRRRRASRQSYAPWASEVRWPAWRGDGQGGRATQPSDLSLKGAAPACRLWLFVARGPGRPEGVAPVTRNAGLLRRGLAVVAFRVPGTATFRSRAT